MKSNLTNIKLVLAALYILLIIVGFTYLFANYNVLDFFSYEFIRLNKDVILGYKRENFLLLAVFFFIFCQNI